MERKFDKALLVGVLFLVLSIGILLYPTLSSMYIDSHQAKLELQYEEEVSNSNQEFIAKEKEKAVNYNKAIKPGAKDTSAFSKESQIQAAKGYGDVLNISGDSTMGFIEIPKISVNLPIFHGTDENILEKGIGHLVGSSVPIGGDSTHSVLTGHSGMASKRLFSDLKDLVIGDMFYIHVLDEVLAYKVDQIETVLPYEMENLYISNGNDYVTLVTCTPYAVNTHRLLVRGTRVEMPKEEDTVVSAETPVKEGLSTRQKGLINGVLMGFAVSFSGLAVAGIVYKVKSKKK